MLLPPAPYLSGRGEVNSIHFIRDRREQLLQTQRHADAIIWHRRRRTPAEPAAFVESPEFTGASCVRRAISVKSVGVIGRMIPIMIRGGKL